MRTGNETGTLCRREISTAKRESSGFKKIFSRCVVEPQGVKRARHTLWPGQSGCAISGQPAF